MYQPRTTFTGFKLGLNNANLYIGIPEKYWQWDDITVSFKGKDKTYRKCDVITSRTFNDHYRPGETYTLLYVLWEERAYEPINKKEETHQQERLL